MLRLPSQDDPRTQTATAALGENAPYRRAKIVANPIAGRGKGEQVALELKAGLEALQVPTEVYCTRGAGDARAHLRCMPPEFDLVVAVGGDGTLREVFSGLLDPSVPVGVLPLGTANVLSLDLHLPRDVDRALEVFATRKVLPIDTFLVNGHLSFLVTGIGIDASIVRDVVERRDGPITKWSYARALARTVRSFRAPALQVEIDGKKLPGEYGWVLVSNVIHYGGVFKLAADRRLDDGLVEVYLFDHGSPVGLLPSAVRGLIGRLPGGRCTRHQARRVKVTASSPTPVQVDGDYRGETPVEIEMSGRQYSLLVP